MGLRTVSPFQDVQQFLNNKPLFLPGHSDLPHVRPHPDPVGKRVGLLHDRGNHGSRALQTGRDCTFEPFGKKLHTPDLVDQDQIRPGHGVFQTGNHQILEGLYIDPVRAHARSSLKTNVRKHAFPALKRVDAEPGPFAGLTDLLGEESAKAAALQPLDQLLNERGLSGTRGSFQKKILNRFHKTTRQRRNRPRQEIRFQPFGVRLEKMPVLLMKC